MSLRNPGISNVPPLLALVMRPLPLLPLQPVLALIIEGIGRRHPRIFERLGPHARKRIGIDPIDLPFAFLLEPRPARPVIRAVKHFPIDADAVISGPFAALIGLVDGEFDGDALFFSRDLRIEGDIEAILALRNAIEAARIDLLGEIVGGLGPLQAPAERLLRAVLHLAPPAAGGASPGGEEWS